MYQATASSITPALSLLFCCAWGVDAQLMCLGASRRSTPPNDVLALTRDIEWLSHRESLLWCGRFSASLICPAGASSQVSARERDPLEKG